MKHLFNLKLAIKTILEYKRFFFILNYVEIIFYLFARDKKRRSSNLLVVSFEPGLTSFN